MSADPGVPVSDKTWLDRLVPWAVGHRTEAVAVLLALSIGVRFVKPTYADYINLLDAVLTPLGFGFLAARVARVAKTGTTEPLP